MQQRLQRQAQGRPAKTPRVHFVAFDLLYLGGASMMEEPLVHRKNLLHEILKPTDVAQACEFIDTDGNAFFQATCEHGLEGVVAKDKSSLYLAGKRSGRWLKVKRVRECEFVIGGYALGGESKEPFSSLLLGLYDGNNGLVYVGQVGTGFSRSEAKRIASLLQELHVPDCPFASPPAIQRLVYWCRPEMVCRVEYGEFTTGGKLRYSVFRTLRDDKPATDCRIADAPGWPRILQWDGGLA
jgi:ATP-dependent DNA ligase